MARIDIVSTNIKSEVIINALFSPEAYLIRVQSRSKALSREPMAYNILKLPFQYR